MITRRCLLRARRLRRREGTAAPRRAAASARRAWRWHCCWACSRSAGRFAAPDSITSCGPRPRSTRPTGCGCPALRQRAGEWPEDRSQQQLILRLRTDAVEFTVPNTRGEGPRWVDRYWWTDSFTLARRPRLPFPPILVVVGWLVVLHVLGEYGPAPHLEDAAGHLRKPRRSTTAPTSSAASRAERIRNVAGEIRAGILASHAMTLRPLEAAAAAREREMVELLLELGGDLDAPLWHRAWCISDVSSVRDALDVHRPPGRERLPRSRGRRGGETSSGTRAGRAARSILTLADPQRRRARVPA